MRYMVGFICVLALGVMGCSETADTGGGGGTAGSGGVGGDGGMGGTGGVGGVGGVSAGCLPLAKPDPGSTITDVDPSQVGDLTGIVSSAQTGDTIRFASGTYDLDGVYIWISTPGVTLRSASGNRDDVVLDGNYQSTEIITVAASDVTIADLTIREAATHPIHVVSTDSADTVNTLIYNVHIVDPREQAIKINPNQGGYFVDDGEIACSHIELTDTGRPNVQPNPAAATPAESMRTRLGGGSSATTSSKGSGATPGCPSTPYTSGAAVATPWWSATCSSITLAAWASAWPRAVRRGPTAAIPALE